MACSSIFNLTNKTCSDMLQDLFLWHVIMPSGIPTFIKSGWHDDHVPSCGHALPRVEVAYLWFIRIDQYVGQGHSILLGKSCIRDCPRYERSGENRRLKCSPSSVLCRAIWSAPCVFGVIMALPTDPLCHLSGSEKVHGWSRWGAEWHHGASFLPEGSGWWVGKLPASNGLVCPTNFSVEPPWFFKLNSLNYTYLPVLHFIGQVTWDLYIEFHINNF